MSDKLAFPFPRVGNRGNKEFLTLGSKCERENFEEDTIIDEIIIFIHISSSDFYFAEKGKVEKNW